MENELNNLTCQINEHSHAKIIGYCIEEGCTSNNKFMCQECFFDVHSGHKVIKIDNLSNIIQNKLKEYYNSLEEDKKNKSFYSIYENNQILNLKRIKEKIVNEIDNKINLYKEHIKKKNSEVLIIIKQ